MNKLLYISPFVSGKRYGGSIVSNNNLEAVRISFDGEVKSITFDHSVNNKTTFNDGYILPEINSKVMIALSNLFQFPGRIGFNSYRLIKEIIFEYSPTHIYLDSSMYGNLSRWVSKKFPEIEIITFLHNIEYDFEVQRLKKYQFRYFPSFWSILFNEKKIVKYSNKIITLHNVDSSRMYDKYGRNSDLCIPVSSGEPKFVKDHFNFNSSLTFGFLGSAFYANVEAAEFIVKLAEQLPQAKFIIAGRGFDKYSKQFEKYNVDVIGEVKCVSDFYRTIDVFISPIFSGAGMKVKIAEAMSYNIPIIASKFSLIGYEDALESSSIFDADTLKQYIFVIEKLLAKNERIQPENSMIYKKKYSFSSNVKRFNILFGKLS